MSFNCKDDTLSIISETSHCTQSNVLLLTTEHITSNRKHTQITLQQTVLCQEHTKLNTTDTNSLVRTVHMSVQCVYDYAQLQYCTEHTSNNLPSCNPDKHQSFDVNNQSEGTFLTRKLFKEYIHYKGLLTKKE